MVRFFQVFLGFFWHIHLIEESMHYWVWEFSKPFLFHWCDPLHWAITWYGDSSFAYCCGSKMDEGFLTGNFREYITLSDYIKSASFYQKERMTQFQTNRKILREGPKEEILKWPTMGRTKSNGMKVQGTIAQSGTNLWLHKHSSRFIGIKSKLK